MEQLACAKTMQRNRHALQQANPFIVVEEYDACHIGCSVYHAHPIVVINDQHTIYEYRAQKSSAWHVKSIPFNEVYTMQHMHSGEVYTDTVPCI